MKSPLTSLILRALDSAPATIGASASVLATTAAAGFIENRNALAPINAIAHAFLHDEARGSAASTLTVRSLLRYTLLAVAWNTLAMGGWALIHNLAAGPTHGRGKKKSLLWGVMVSLLAFVVDYKLVPPRWRPGIEAHLSTRGIFAAYVALALGLALSPARKP